MKIGLSADTRSNALATGSHPQGFTIAEHVVASDNSQGIATVFVFQDIKKPQGLSIEVRLL